MTDWKKWLTDNALGKNLYAQKLEETPEGSVWQFTIVRDSDYKPVNVNKAIAFILEKEERKVTKELYGVLIKKDLTAMVDRKIKDITVLYL